MYKRYDKEAMLEDYLKLEPSLFIFGITEESKDKEIEEIKSEMKYMKTMVTSLFEVMKKEKKI
jgi:hypothetical protein